MESDQPAEDPLVCAECGRQSESDAAWRAYLDDDGLHVIQPLNPGVYEVTATPVQTAAPSRRRSASRADPAEQY